MKNSLTDTVTLDEATIGADEIVTGAPRAQLTTVSNAGVSGEVDNTDLKFPRLQIVQGVGPLSEVKELNKGDIVLNGEYRISDGETPVELVVCQIGKQFEEDIPYGSEEIPRIVNTKQEVLKLNGTTEGHRENGKWVRPSWKAIADALIAIRAPEGISDDDRDMYFPFDAPDKSHWSFARWVIKGVAYKEAAVDIFTAASMYYRDGLKNGTFKLTTHKKTYGPNNVMVPQIVKGSRIDKKLSSWLGTLA